MMNYLSIADSIISFIVCLALAVLVGVVAYLLKEVKRLGYREVALQREIDDQESNHYNLIVELSGRIKTQGDQIKKIKKKIKR